jgi:hypothetical protein
MDHDRVMERAVASKAPRFHGRDAGGGVLRCLGAPTAPRRGKYRTIRLLQLQLVHPLRCARGCDELVVQVDESACL